MIADYLRRVKTILDIEFDIREDDVLTEFIENFIQMVNLYVGADELPHELEFVVIECTVARFLRRGSEGFASESMGEVNISYEEIIAPYIPYLDKYKFANNPNVRFL